MEDFSRRAELLRNYTVPIIDPPYQKISEWEKFDYPHWREWMGQNWNISVYITLTYLFLIFTGKEWMKTREAFKLRRPLIFWNIGLAVFSICGFHRSFTHLVYTLWNTPDGFHVTVCSREGMTLAVLFWELAGTLSKAVELGDTAFVVLRKNPLIFLHWYHHISVMLVTFYTYESNDPYHRWPMTMNLGVHSIMYTYYALRAAGFKIPKSIAMCLTVVQLIQMLMGVTLNVYSLYAIRQGWDCARKEFNIYLHLGMYASYMILFANFFANAYFKKSGKDSAIKSKTN